VQQHQRFDAPTSARGSLGQALFAPRGVALIGASGDPGKHASLPQRYLRKHGYPGRVYPINPTRPEILGERAFPSVRAVPDSVDHAFIMVRTESVVGAVRDCIEAGVACATILTGGFAEAGAAGRARQHELLDVAKGRIRLLGPNSLGLINTHTPLTLSANEVLEQASLERGRVGLISQSGSLIGALISRGQARGMAFSSVVSVGNELDLSVGEIGEMMIDDPDTDAILLFLETVRHREALAAMGRRAYAAGKPVIAYTLGRSAVGQKLASSHTGALVGSGAAVAAFLRDNAIVHVENFETLLEAPNLFLKSPGVTRSRVCALTTTGGGAALVLDNLGLRGIEVAPPGATAVERLSAKGIQVDNVPLVDLTLSGTNAATYGAVLNEFLDSGDCDTVIAVVGSSAQSRPDRAVAPIVEASKTAKKPIAVFLTPHAEESLGMLQKAGIAAFRTPEACADAVRALLQRRSPVERPLGLACPAAAVSLLQEKPDPTLGARLLAGLGIAMPQTLVCRSASLAEFDALVSGVSRYPVVLKIVSADIPHKTEAGGVMLGLADAGSLRRAAAAMLDTVRARDPDARLDGFEVQSMETGLAEVIVGYRLDTQVGPTITVGSGGVLSELLRDVVTRVAPVSVADAREMIGEVRTLRAIAGYRSLPEGDVEALAQTISSLSTLALAGQPGLRDVEINPLLVKAKGEGVVALDVLTLFGTESAT
jgi:acyl-CoA synthetase (NDP forming)